MENLPSPTVMFLDSSTSEVTETKTIFVEMETDMEQSVLINNARFTLINSKNTRE